MTKAEVRAKIHEIGIIPAVRLYNADDHRWERER